MADFRILSASGPDSSGRTAVYTAEKEGESGVGIRDEGKHHMFCGNMGEHEEGGVGISKAGKQCMFCETAGRQAKSRIGFRKAGKHCIFCGILGE